MAARHRPTPHRGDLTTQPHNGASGTDSGTAGQTGSTATPDPLPNTSKINSWSLPTQSVDQG
jgi:hypothetical protein